jgi:hypothetical protein
MHTEGGVGLVGGGGGGNQKERKGSFDRKREQVLFSLSVTLSRNKIRGGGGGGRRSLLLVVDGSRRRRKGNYWVCKKFCRPPPDRSIFGSHSL